MSMSSSFVYGYGFACDFEVKKFIEFVKAHRDAFCRSPKEVEMYDELMAFTGDEDEEDLDELFEDYEPDRHGGYGTGTVIANIMCRETYVTFAFHHSDDECDTDASIVFEQTYPWWYNETEKNLTERKLYEICLKYMDELGIKGAPEHLELEYWG